MNIGNFRKLLKANKVSNLEMASLLGIGKSTLESRFRGQTKFTVPETERILSFFNISFEDLMYGEIIRYNDKFYIVNQVQKEGIEAFLSHASKL
jgi:transcriptional regulator with XRE-family HTH domain